MKPLECSLAFNNRCCSSLSLSSVFAGLKILEKSGLIKVRSFNMSPDFALKEQYPHRYVIELKAEGKTLAFDMADGYQDFDFPENFDRQLDAIDYYFKSSYSEEFAQQLRNKDKFKIFGMAYHCSCRGNYFEKAVIKNALQNKDIKAVAYSTLTMYRYQHGLNYKKFESNNHFDSYNLLFWTRLWEWEQVTKESIMVAYKELSRSQAEEKAEAQRQMLRQTNEERIQAVRLLRETFGDRFVGGLSDSVMSRKEAPELITADPRICTREGYLDSLKKNYVHILSKGLHGCVGARYGETFAAGRAMITDPFVYEPIGELKEGVNYLRYTSPEEMVQKAMQLTNDVDTVHMMEDSNFKYYNEFVRPDMRMLNALRVAFPEHFE